MGLAHIEHTHDSGMPQLSSSPCLLQQPLTGPLFIEITSQHLDGDR